MTARAAKNLSSRGRVLVVGGCQDFVGAPYLAAIAALRTGAESVIVMAPERVAWAINALSPDLMTRKLRGKFLTRAHERAIRRQAKTADVLVIGMGAGLHKETQALMRALMDLPLPKIIDADALKALRSSNIENAILTPNEGEWRSLQERSDIDALLSRGNVIVKKGLPTELRARRVRISVKTNKGLRKAGAGDVLAGMISGFLVTGLSPAEAATRACEVGNDIADILTEKKRGYLFLASDIANELSSRS